MLQTCSNCGKTGHNKRTCSAPQKELTRRKRGAPLGNTNALQHGYYSPRFRKGDLQSLSSLEDHLDVTSEIKVLRVAIDRLAVMLDSQPDMPQTIGLCSTMTHVASRLGHLIKLQKIIDAERSNIDPMFREVLLEFAEEHDLD
ncbi:MAG: hypothetical protein ABFS03_13520 [Chloroflexota bacterium]